MGIGLNANVESSLINNFINVDSKATRGEIQGLPILPLPIFWLLAIIKVP